MTALGLRRYDWDVDHAADGPYRVESATGKWVLYEDIAPFIQALTDPENQPNQFGLVLAAEADGALADLHTSYGATIKRQVEEYADALAELRAEAAQLNYQLSAQTEVLAGVCRQRDELQKRVRHAFDCWFAKGERGPGKRGVCTCGLGAALAPTRSGE